MQGDNQKGRDELGVALLTLWLKKVYKGGERAIVYEKPMKGERASNKEKPTGNERAIKLEKPREDERAMSREKPKEAERGRGA